MGANMSTNVSDCNGHGLSSSLRPRLDDIPESCVALVLMRLDPTEICRLARLNRAFRGASLADFVWDSKLPSNYRLIVERVFGDNATYMMNLSKKDLYARLSRRNPFDGGTMEMWLEKATGALCVSLSSKALAITGIDDRRYWRRISTDESRFHTVSYLQQIWWLEVDGQLQFPFPAGTYSVYFRLQLGKPSKRLGRRTCNNEQIHGWDIRPVRFKLTTSDGQSALSKCYLDNPGNWVHYHVADFDVENPYELKNIEFSLTQIDCTHTKGGLCVDSVFIVPSSLKLDGLCRM